MRGCARARSVVGVKDGGSHHQLLLDLLTLACLLRVSLLLAHLGLGLSLGLSCALCLRLRVVPTLAAAATVAARLRLLLP